MSANISHVTRRSIVAATAAIALGQAVRPVLAAESTIKVHKDPNCGCCSGWVQHLRDAGFAVVVDETSDLAAVRSRLGIPTDLTACHTAEIDDYLLEGHVPALAVRRLLGERPKGRGLAVPGMPAGSPGMEGGPSEPFTVFLFGAEGHVPFMRFVGQQVTG